MKKQLVLTAALISLSACRSGGDVTLFDMFSFESDEQTVVIADEAVPVPASASYHLMKRGDRYAEAEYPIPSYVYGLAAGRAVNKMLEETPEFLPKTKKRRFMSPPPFPLTAICRKKRPCCQTRRCAILSIMPECITLSRMNKRRNIS